MREVLQLEGHGLLGRMFWTDPSIQLLQNLLSKAFFHFSIRDNNANCVLKPFLYPHK